jgi:hypothetical protein
MKTNIILFLLLLSQGFARATPAITIEINGDPLTSGSSHFLEEETLFEVTDPVKINLLDEQDAVEVAFPNIPPGYYYGQSSTGGEFWTPVTPLIPHPAADTLTFSDQPGGAVTIFYRILRVAYCAFISIRNDGDTPLSNIAASLNGPESAAFTLDLSFTETSLNPGASTSLRVCFSSGDTNEYHATLEITSNDAPFTLELIGDNEPGPGTPENELRMGEFTLLPAVSGSSATFTGTIFGTANATIALEGSTDLGLLDDWSEVTRVTLSASGEAMIDPPVNAGLPGADKYFLRLRQL